MTREEQIDIAAKISSVVHCNSTPNIYAVAFYCFIDGVKWADENPKEGMVNSDKVREWIKENMYECDNGEKWVNTYFHTMKEMLNDLRKTMKE